MSNYKPFNGHTEGTLEVLEEDGNYSLLIDDGEPGTMYIAREIQQGESNGEDDAEFIAEAWNSYYPSREIIEKLVGTVKMLSDIVREFPDESDYEGFEDERPTVIANEVLTEARAFLNK